MIAKIMSPNSITVEADYGSWLAVDKVVLVRLLLPLSGLCHCLYTHVSCCSRRMESTALPARLRCRLYCIHRVGFVDASK